VFSNLLANSSHCPATMTTKAFSMKKYGAKSQFSLLLSTLQYWCISFAKHVFQ
jgi:hypothetical protein